MIFCIVYVISGMGSVGIVICQKFVCNGYIVVVGCVLNLFCKLVWLCEQCELGFDFIVFEGDVIDWVLIVVVFVKVKVEVGEIDVLVNNVGGSCDVLFWQMIQDDWNVVMGFNLYVLFNIIKQVIDGMSMWGWGCIVNIGLVSVYKGQIGQVNFVIVKVVMYGFSCVLVNEVVICGVIVNIILLGYIVSQVISSFLLDVLDWLVVFVLICCFGKLEEVVSLCVWLVLDDVVYVIGVDYVVNGGLYMF